MAKIAFIGLGNMGLPMAQNLARAGHDVTGFDLAPAALQALQSAGGKAAAGAAEAARGADVVVTMLPMGQHVADVLTGENGVFSVLAPGALAIDCSTIDVTTARAVHEAAEARGLQMLDAPVSGGTVGAEAGTLTFMAGGSEAAFAAAGPVLAAMGRNIVHAGGPGTGQAAKLCNNMMLGVQMISVCEGFALADRLGLDRQKLFDIASKSSGSCWSLTTNCPVPGPVPTSPANRGYQGGFMTDLMLKDMKLAQEAALGSDAPTPLATLATALYGLAATRGQGKKDFSSILELLSRV
jgi:3-hydroxyisobutyrate dehydrogenase